MIIVLFLQIGYLTMLSENVLVNRTIADWNHLPEGVKGFSPVKIHSFPKRG
jgi:hypothetical protein